MTAQAVPVARSRTHAEPVAPGSLLLHPVALAAIALLIANDHLLKRVAPGVLTGKLSDFAGLVFFPLFLRALLEMTLGPRARSSRTLGALSLISVVLTGAVFAWVKTTALGAETYRVGLGLLQWPFGAALDLVRGHGLPGLWRVAVTRDATDLVALPALAVPLWIASRQTRTGGLRASTASST